MEAINSSLNLDTKKTFSSQEIHSLEQVSRVLEPFHTFTVEVRAYKFVQLKQDCLVVSRRKHFE